MRIEITEETIRDGLKSAMDDLDLLTLDPSFITEDEILSFLDDCYQTVVDYYDLFGTIRTDYRDIVMDTARLYGLED